MMTVCLNPVPGSTCEVDMNDSCAAGKLLRVACEP